MKFLGIIFDMDGTIVSTEQVWQAAIERILADRNIRASKSELTEIQNVSRGAGIEHSCLMLKQRFGLPDDIPTLAREMVTGANQHFEQDLRLIEGFVEFHRHATGTHQLKTGLATNADDTTLLAAKRGLNLEQYFGQHIYNASHVGNRPKPDPALFLHTADQLELWPSKCIVIEDSSHGIIAAKDAGMFCIGINTAGSAERLKDADLIINHYEHIDLQQLLKKIP